MNKKGSILDIMYVAAIAIPAIIATLAIGYMFNVGYDAVITDWNSTSTVAGNALTNAETAINGVLVNVLPFIPIFMAIGALLLAYFIPTHPIFFPISLLVGTLTVLFSFYFSNIINEFFTVGGALTSYINNYSLVITVGQNLPTFAVVFVGLMMIIMYSRRDVLAGVVSI